MDPISIVFLVIGCVILGAEACAYVKKKFFHHKEEQHKGGMTIKADELTMDGDFSQLSGENHNKDPSADANNHISGKNVEITITNSSKSMDHLSATYEKRGGSEVGKQLASDLTRIVSPVSDIVEVAEVIERGASKFKWSFGPKHKDKKKEYEKQDHSIVELDDVISVDDTSDMEPVQLFSKGGRLYAASSDSNRTSPVPEKYTIESPDTSNVFIHPVILYSKNPSVWDNPAFAAQNDSGHGRSPATKEKILHARKCDNLVAQQTLSNDSNLTQRSLSEPDLIAPIREFITPHIHINGVHSCDASPRHSPVPPHKTFAKSKLREESHVIASESGVSNASRDYAYYSDSIEGSVRHPPLLKLGKNKVQQDPDIFASESYAHLYGETDVWV